MNDAEFWKIIRQAGSEADGDLDAIIGAVHEQLTKLTPSEIKSFNAIMGAKVAAAYTWKLWGAAYLMNGGCSDDGFEYFRGWLVAQGKSVYEAALADPDSLAKIADPENDEYECEEILYVAMNAYEEVAGEDLDLTPSAEAPKPSGDEWDFEDPDENAKYLPRLARKFSL